MYKLYTCNAVSRACARARVAETNAGRFSAVTARTANGSTPRFWVCESGGADVIIIVKRRNNNALPPTMYVRVRADNDNTSSRHVESHAARRVIIVIIIVIVVIIVVLHGVCSCYLSCKSFVRNQSRTRRFDIGAFRVAVLAYASSAAFITVPVVAVLVIVIVFGRGIGREHSIRVIIKFRPPSSYNVIII